MGKRNPTKQRVKELRQWAAMARLVGEYHPIIRAQVVYTMTVWRSYDSMAAYYYGIEMRQGGE